MSTPQRGLIYARVSTDEQAKPELASIPHQIEACRKLARLEGVPISDNDLFVDDETGQSADRPGITDALQKASGYTHAYMYDATRLARRRAVATLIRDELSENGVELRFVHGDTSRMDEESRVFLESIQDAASEAEIIRLKRRTRMGRERRAKRGLHAGKLPTGWRAVLGKRGETVGYEHDEEYDRFFADLESIFLSGMPYMRFPSEMLARGHRSPNTGDRWSVGALKYMLRNPFNMGHIVYGYRTRDKSDRVVIRDNHEPRWNNPAAVQAELDRRDKLHGGATAQKHKFASLLVCHFCGWNLVSQSAHHTLADGTPKTYVYYVCKKHQEYLAGRWSEDCQANQISELNAIAQLAEWAQDLIEPEAFDRYIAEQNGTNVARVHAEHDEVAAQIDDVDSKLETLADRLSVVPDGAVAAVQKRMSDLSEERELLASRLDKVSDKLDRTREQDDRKDELKRLIDRAEDVLHNAPPHVLLSSFHPVFPDGIPVRKGELLLPRG